MGADSDWIITRTPEPPGAFKPGRVVRYVPGHIPVEEKVSIPKLMILTVFCFSVIYLIWG
jgi:hypothetical protein